MMQRTSVGILGIGSYVPPDVRQNDWWPASVVADWLAKRSAAAEALAREPAPDLTDGMRRVIDAMTALEDDPFNGAVARRVMPDGMTATDMEVRAAKDAIERAGIDAADIDLLLCHTSVPEYLFTNGACLLHARLGLPTTCFALSTEGAQNSFLLQLALAEQMITGGQTRYALLVQSSSVSSLLEQTDPISPSFGDAATAVVIGRVSEGRGVRGAAYRTDGSVHGALVATVRGARWYETGRVVLHSANPGHAQKLFREIPDRGREVVAAALTDASVVAQQIQFFGVHQATSWAAELTQEHFGLPRDVRSVNSFSTTANILACSIPLSLAIGEKQALLRPDDLVLMFAAGAGYSYASVVLRWGR